jgi:outer membrane protein OmpA-like peptidoglycan-associated protein
MTYSNADRLTKQRAEQIENYLLRAGVKSERVKVIGVGKNYPKLANHNYENRRQNQRVEILIK